MRLAPRFPACIHPSSNVHAQRYIAMTACHASMLTATTSPTCHHNIAYLSKLCLVLLGHCHCPKAKSRVERPLRTAIRFTRTTSVLQQSKNDTETEATRKTYAYTAGLLVKRTAQDVFPAATAVTQQVQSRVFIHHPANQPYHAHSEVHTSCVQDMPDTTGMDTAVRAKKRAKPHSHNQATSH